MRDENRKSVDNKNDSQSQSGVMTLHNNSQTHTHNGQRNRCQNCQSYISHRFARVFGNNDDEVYGCINCSTLHSLRDGEGGVTGD